MAINPVLAEDATAKGALFPLPAPGEVFVVKRTGVNFTASSSSKKLSGSGAAFLTNRRIVFLRDGAPDKHKDFTSVELPLHLVKGPSEGDAQPQFRQPMFGANYLEGKVDPVFTAVHPLPGTAKWSLTFTKGGCMTFLRSFYSLHKRALTSPAETVGLDPQFATQMQMGQQAAFFDPTDPSHLYITQPVPLHPPPGYAANIPSPSAPPLSPQPGMGQQGGSQMPYGGPPSPYPQMPPYNQQPHQPTPPYTPQPQQQHPPSPYGHLPPQQQQPPYNPYQQAPPYPPHQQQQNNSFPQYGTNPHQPVMQQQHQPHQQPPPYSGGLPPYQYQYSNPSPSNSAPSSQPPYHPNQSPYGQMPPTPPVPQQQQQQQQWPHQLPSGGQQQPQQQQPLYPPYQPPPAP